MSLRTSVTISHALCHQGNTLKLYWVNMPHKCLVFIKHHSDMYWGIVWLKKCVNSFPCTQPPSQDFLTLLGKNLTDVNLYKTLL